MTSDHQEEPQQQAVQQSEITNQETFHVEDLKKLTLVSEGNSIANQETVSDSESLNNPSTMLHHSAVTHPVHLMRGMIFKVKSLKNVE